MSTKHTARVGIALVALLLVTFAFVAAPKAPAAAPVAAKFVSVSSAYAEESATPAEGEAAAGEAKGEAEIPHTTGTLTQQQEADLGNAWSGMDGYSILIVSILSLLVIVGIVGFGAVKQARA